MPLFHLAVLALIQGITEFLPISSSGHLVLVPALTGWQDQGLVLDIAVHVGTLGAVALYFHRDVAGLFKGLGRLLQGRMDGSARLLLLLVVATVPVVVAGLAVKALWGTNFRNVEVIAWATLGFGLVLWLADRVGVTARRMDHLGWRDAVILGLFQGLALIPGTSRSGITMTAGRFLGLERPDAARFSMLMSLPTILAAGLLAGLDLYETGDAALTLDAVLAAVFAFVAALLAVALLMAWLRRAGFMPFVVYRIVLGGVLLALVYGTGLSL